MCGGSDDTRLSLDHFSVIALVASSYCAPEQLPCSCWRPLCSRAQAPDRVYLHPVLRNLTALAPLYSPLLNFDSRSWSPTKNCRCWKLSFRKSHSPTLAQPRARETTADLTRLEASQVEADASLNCEASMGCRQSLYDLTQLRSIAAGRATKQHEVMARNERKARRCRIYQRTGHYREQLRPLRPIKYSLKIRAASWLRFKAARTVSNDGC